MKQSQNLTVIGIIALIAIVAIGAVMWTGGAFSTVGKTTGTPTPSTGGISTTPTGAVVATLCPDALTTSVTLKVYNKLDTAATQTMNNTILLYEMSDAKEALVMTTNAGATATLDCGKTYRVKLLSDDTNDFSAKILGVRSGKGAVLGADGKYVEFQTAGATYNLELDGKKHSNLTLKLFDNKANGWVFDSTSGTAGNYQASPVNFVSAVNATTVMNITTGQNIDATYTLRAASAYADFADFGAIVYVNASVKVWDTPTLTYNGVVLDPADLTTSEKRAYSEYEYAFVLPAAPADKALIPDKDQVMKLQISALSDVDPTATDDLDVWFVSIGASKQVSGNGVVYATTTDAATSITPVYVEQKSSISVV